jgi:hypothetical protein
VKSSTIFIEIFLSDLFSEYKRSVSSTNHIIDSKPNCIHHSSSGSRIE